MTEKIPKDSNGFRPALSILFIFIAQFLCNYSAYSQDNAYTISRDKLVETLKKKHIDKAWTQSINRFYFNTCDSLIAKNVVVDSRSIKVILTRLFDASQLKISNKSVSVLRIPSVNTFFMQTLATYKKRPLAGLYRQIGITQIAILESTFDGLVLGDSIGLVVGIREMLSNPFLISTRLADPKYLPFRDTLLYFLANGAPEILTEKLAGNDPLFTSLANKSTNPTVRAVTQIAKDNYYDRVLPFGLAIQENRVTEDSIRKLSLNPSEYYRAFADETIRLYTNPDRGVKLYLEQPIAALNKSLANKFYINEINTLHDSPDKVRFQILNNLSARELYFLLIGGSGQLYTSSFLYLYKKFIAESQKEGLDKFLKDVDYYQFGQFVSNISVYRLVDEFIEHLHEEKFAELMRNYFSKNLSPRLSDNEIILNAMTISEILSEINHHPVVQRNLLGYINTYENAKVKQDIMLQRIFAGLKNILMNKTDYTSDPTYDVLPIKRLQKNNAIVQAAFFYDDEDGAGSFASSVASYDKKIWDKTDKGNYVVFNSLSGNNMRVYMNKPNTKPGSDSAQDEMLRHIRQEDYEVTSFIHRGHSYHLQQSLRKITPAAAFVFLGSCGGYSEVLNVFNLNPDVNIIVSRNIGSMLINDPLLQRINLDLVNNKDINWNNTWAHFNSVFTSKQTKDLFSSYIPPNKYVGVKFIRKVLSY